MGGMDLEFLGHEYRKCFILVQDNSPLLIFNSKKYTMHIINFLTTKITITLYWDMTRCRVSSIRLINGLCESVFFQPHSHVANILF